MSRSLRYLILFLTAVLLISAVPLCASAEDNGDYKLLALTFDDGPGNYTEKLLDAFKERDVKSTFFVVGKSAAKYPELLERMSDEGHQLGNHSYSHAYLTSLSAERITEELEKCSRYLQAAAGEEEAFYIRPTYGAYNSKLKAVADAPLITWSVDPKDWEHRNTDTIVKNIMRTVQDGDIILMHDIHKFSVDAAIIVVDKLIEQGYEFVTVSELLRRRGVTPESGSVYTSARNTGVNLGPPIDPEAYDETLIENHPAYEAICYTRHTGLFSGSSGDAFYPNKYLSRGMFVTVLGRFAGAAVQTTDNYTEYDDVKPEMYYAPYVKWAAESHIASEPDDGRFRPDDPITHGQFSAWLTQYLNLLSPGLSEQQKTDLFPGMNTEENSALYSELGLITGVSGDLGDPKTL